MAILIVMIFQINRDRVDIVTMVLRYPTSRRGKLSLVTGKPGRYVASGALLRDFFNCHDAM